MDLRAAPERHELEAALIRPAGEDRIPARLLLRFGQIKSVEEPPLALSFATSDDPLATDGTKTTPADVVEHIAPLSKGEDYSRPAIPAGLSG